MTNHRWQTPFGILTALLALPLAGCATARPGGHDEGLPARARQVEIRRTEHGVPHILAGNLRAAGFALAWVQLEDHGEGIIRGMEAARGRLSLIDGPSRIDADARAQRRHARAVAALPLLEQDTRDVYEGFAEGMNHFIRVHGDGLPPWATPDFTGADVLSRDIGTAADPAAGRFRQLLASDASDARVLHYQQGDWRRSPAGTGAKRPTRQRGVPADTAWNEGSDDDDVGSNAWALSPSRTASGRAILLRNPHLAWTAGYYEAHIRVPGKLDFYGDFRIGGPFTVIGGFNTELGFATTNNASRNHELYALRLDPARPWHVLFDGASVPLRVDTVRVEFTERGRRGVAAREFIDSPIGPVFHMSDSLAYVVRTAMDGDHRAGEQWLRMMKARSLEEYLEAMRMQARTTSNFTYADRAGNIHYAWVSTAPLLPHPAGGDSLAVLATHSAQVWSRIAPFDSLPQLLNPPGGYVHNENDSPHFTNLNAIMADSFAFHVEPPRLRLRSQLGASLLHNDSVFSLEHVVERKHTPRMLLAERVKHDLLAAVRAAAAGVATPVADGVRLLEDWDNTVRADSRGAVLFEAWWAQYRALMDGADLHAAEWSTAEPMTTPRGLSDPVRAAAAFETAVDEVIRRHGRLDVRWGDVHRVRRGAVDVPVAGCSGILGCFRVLAFTQVQDGTRVVTGGDGWILAVEFGDTPRALSVLGYGQSPDPSSPYHDDQAGMFAAGTLKTVRFTEEDIAASTLRRYRPGEQRR